MRVGFLGTGAIAAAMVRGLAGQGHLILVSPRNASTAATLAAELPEVAIAPNDALVAGSDVVFLCLLARTAEEVLPGLPFRPDQTVISVMVDAPLANLRRLCAPAREIAITIPLPPIAGGGCPLPVYPASPALDAIAQLSDQTSLTVAFNSLFWTTQFNDFFQSINVPQQDRPQDQFFVASQQQLRNISFVTQWLLPFGLLAIGGLVLWSRRERRHEA